MRSWSCIICSWPEAKIQALEQMLFRGCTDEEIAATVAEGVNNRMIARHRKMHIPEHVRAVLEEQREAHAAWSLQTLIESQEAAQEFANKAAECGDFTGAANCINSLTRSLDILAATAGMATKRSATVGTQTSVQMQIATPDQVKLMIEDYKASNEPILVESRPVHD